MKKIFLTIFISAFNLIAFSQQQAVIKKEAQLMSDAAANGDFAKTVSFIYPKVLESWGGKQEVLKKSKDFGARLQSPGLAISSITVGEPGKVQKIGKREFCMLNDRVILNANGTIMSNNLSVLAVSENKGIKWYFISSGMVSDETLYHFLSRN